VINHYDYNVFLYCQVITTTTTCFSLMTGDNYDYNVFLYHTEEDRDTAEKIRSSLSDRGYDVFLSADVREGEGRCLTAVILSSCPLI